MLARSALTVIVLLAAVPASAATLETSFAFANGGQLLTCVVTNKSNKPLDVEVGFFGLSGSVVTPAFDFCNGAPLQPGDTCQLILDPDDDGRCVVTGKPKKLRANVTVFGPLPDRRVEAVLEATK